MLRIIAEQGQAPRLDKCGQDHRSVRRGPRGVLPPLRSRTCNLIRSAVAPDRLPIAVLRDRQIQSDCASRVQSWSDRDQAKAEACGIAPSSLLPAQVANSGGKLMTPEQL